MKYDILMVISIWQLSIHFMFQYMAWGCEPQFDLSYFYGKTKLHSCLIKHHAT